MRAVKRATQDVCRGARLKETAFPSALAAQAGESPLINVSPIRLQLAAVSAISILLIGVERLILAPQLLQAIASLRTRMVTSFSVCWWHFWQRIRRIVRSEVENFMRRTAGQGPQMARDQS
jgi:hypothetical protein